MSASRILALPALAAACALISGRVGGAEDEAGVAFEMLHTRDAQLAEATAYAEQSRGAAHALCSVTRGVNALDFGPAPVDLVTVPRRRHEPRTAADLTVRWEPTEVWTLTSAAGGYDGFTDFRSIWLHEYYRQLFAVVPGYREVQPRGWHVLAGGRAAYVPGTAYAQATLVFQDDAVAPAYEPQIRAPLRRGRDRLRTRGLRLSTENILSPTVRVLLETSATDTTGRKPRFSAQTSANWAATRAVTLRLTVAAVRERPAFHAESAALVIERDWDGRWFAGLMLRGYRDSGEVIDPALISTAAPALRSVHAAASLRYQGRRASLRLEAGPYRTRYDPTPAASRHFSRLYAGRNWLRAQLSATWQL